MSINPITEVLQEFQIQLKMNISLMGTLKGNTPLEDIAGLKENRAAFFGGTPVVWAHERL